MEGRKETAYQVEFTLSSKRHFYEVLDYLYQHYSIERAEQLADELESAAQRLKYLPHRGTKEKWLSDRNRDYRFILYKRTKRADIKIIYYIDENTKMVYVTDYFPTEIDIESIAERNAE